MTYRIAFNRMNKITVAAMFLLSVLLLPNAVMAQPNGLPKAFTADYSVLRGSLTLGNLHTSLAYKGSGYEYKKYTKATGMAALLTGIKITENSDGRLSGSNIIPSNYLFNQSRRKKTRIDKAQFSGRKASGSYKGTAYNINVPNGAQDRASLELALARDLTFNKANLQYNVVERGTVKRYKFKKLGVEQIQTAAGVFSATKVKVIRDSKKRETIFWLAKNMNYMPVKVMHTEKGEVITTILKRYTAQ